MRQQPCRGEFTAVCKGKLGMSFADIRETLATVRIVCLTHPVTVEAHDRAIEGAERIVASALLGDCKILYAEVCSIRQVIERRLTIINPFLAT